MNLFNKMNYSMFISMVSATTILGAIIAYKDGGKYLKEAHRFDDVSISEQWTPEAIKNDEENKRTLEYMGYGFIGFGLASSLLGGFYLQEEFRNGTHKKIIERIEEREKKKRLEEVL